MIVRCEKCGRRYDDAECWTICPHGPLWAGPDRYCREHDLVDCQHVHLAAAAPDPWWQDKPVKRFVVICPCGCQRSSTISSGGLWRCQPHADGILIRPQTDTLPLKLAAWILYVLFRLRTAKGLLVWIVFDGDACLRLETPHRLRAVRGGLLATPHGSASA